MEVIRFVFASIFLLGGVISMIGLIIWKGIGFETQFTGFIQ